MDILKDRKDIAELSGLYIDMQEKAKSAGQELAQREKDDDAFGAPNKKKKAKRWWDDDGDGKGYEKHEVKGKFKKEEVVRESGWHRRNPEKVGTPEDPDYDVLRGKGKPVKASKPATTGKASKKPPGVYKPDKDGKMVRQEEKVSEMKAISQLNQLYAKMQTAPQELDEKQKDTPDQVKAVIAYDKARKGTDDATYDSEHGKKKQAKKERDYAKWQRDKGAEDAQKSGHPWEHAKGSTREKEGKKSVKHAHIKDSFSDWRYELRELVATEVEDEKEIKEKKVKNKVVIDPELKLEAVAEDLGAELVSVEEVDGLGKPELQEKDLNAAERRALPDKDFALPGKGKGPEGKQAGSYPIPDKSHARMALAMVAKHGTSEKKAKVRAAVAKKFPGIKQETYDPIEDAVEYFYAEGINEEGLDLIIEEIGLEEFVDFIDGGAVELNEERAARRASVRAKKFPQVKAEVDKADAAKKKAKKGEYASSYAKKETDVTVYDDKPAAKKKVVAKKPVAKKVQKAVVKVKPSQPKKPASKKGLRDKITTAYKAGVKRHKKAVQPARVFAKGMKAGAKKTVKFAKDVKKAVVGEEVVDEAKVDTGKSADEKATARNQRNNPKKGDPGFGKFATSVFIKRKEGQSLAWGKDSAASEKRREAHAKKRGVKEDQDKGYVVTASDKKGNTKAWQGYKAGVKSKTTGKPLYRAADHLKEEDKAFDNVVRALRKKHGESGVLTKDSPKPQPQKTKVKTKPQKPLTDAEKNQREVDARYGRTPWNPKGSLGT